MINNIVVVVFSSLHRLLRIVLRTDRPLECLTDGKRMAGTDTSVGARVKHSGSGTGQEVVPPGGL